MKTQLTMAFLTIVAAGLCGAQGRNGQGTVTGTASPNLNMASLQTVSGPVSAVHIGYGTQYPSITINKIQIKVAPVWYLLDNNFEIKIGDVLNVQAASSKTAGDPYLYAVQISGAAGNIVLRNASGVPLWTGGKAAGGQPAANGGCLTGSTTATVTGTIDQITSGTGIQMPALVLKTADGKLLTFKLGPERVLLASDLELKVGDTVTIQYAVSCLDELVALAITDASGTTVILREGTGRPAWN